MSAPVEDDEARVWNLRAEDAPERRWEQPVVRAPHDQRRHRDPTQRVRDVGGEEVTSDLPEPDGADPKRVARQQGQAAGGRADRSRHGEDVPPPCVGREDPGGRDEREAVDELGRVGGDLQRGRPAHRVADEGRGAKALALEPVTEPRRPLPVPKARKPDDVDVVIRFEGGDRGTPPIGRRGDPVQEHEGRGHYRKRSRSGGITRSRAEPSPSSSRPRTIAAGMPSVLPMTSSAAPAISSATAICVVRSSYPTRSRRPRRSRSGAKPATTIATSVVPCRKGRPKESLT